MLILRTDKPSITVPHSKLAALHSKLCYHCCCTLPFHWYISSYITPAMDPLQVALQYNASFLRPVRSSNPPRMRGASGNETIHARMVWERDYISCISRIAEWAVDHAYCALILHQPCVSGPGFGSTSPAISSFDAIVVAVSSTISKFTTVATATALCKPRESDAAFPRVRVFLRDLRRARAIKRPWKRPILARQSSKSIIILSRTALHSWFTLYFN